MSICGFRVLGCTKVLGSRGVFVRWTPHPVIVTISHSKDYIRVLLYSYYTTITGWGVLLRYMKGRYLGVCLGFRVWGSGGLSTNGKDNGNYYSM